MNDYICVEHIIRKSVGIDNSRLFWCINTNRKLIWHYLDDFFGGSGNYDVAMQQFKLVISWMDRLGIPTAPDKVSPPNTVQKILGYLYSTKITPTVSIPTAKITKTLKQINVMLRRKTATRKELECLVGLLMWISVVVFPGKAFVRRLEQVLHLETRRDGDKVRLKHYVLSDLRWWAVTLRSGLLVGVPIRWLLKQPDEADIVVKTDAASLVGIGGWTSEGQAYQVKLVDVKWEWAVARRPSLKNQGIKIQVLELMGSLIAARLWGKSWQSKCVTFYNDNPGAAGAIINKNANLRRFDMNFLIREFAHVAVHNRYMFWGIHVKGVDNERADALSRFKTWDSVGYQLEPMDKVIDITNDILEKLVLEPENKCN